MAAPTKTKTWQYQHYSNPAGTIPPGGLQSGSSTWDGDNRMVLWNIKNMLVNATGTPWTVVSSSKATVAGAADYWTTPDNVLFKDATTNFSWIVLKQTGIASNFQICISCEADRTQVEVYGWNIAEARALQYYIRNKGLSDRAITYPGADEIGCLLLASYLCRQAGFRPRVWPRYSSVHSPDIITVYEDRPIHELLKAHLAPLGGVIADSPKEADLVLYVNAPAHNQGEGMYQWLVWQGMDSQRSSLPEAVSTYIDQVERDPVFKSTKQEMETPHRSPEEFVRALLMDIEAGRPVAIADVAFVNGSDLLLGNLLVKNPEISSLYAYGGWNTAGNTLGTVLAQASIRALELSSNSSSEQTQAHLEFLFWL